MCNHHPYWFPRDPVSPESKPRNRSPSRPAPASAHPLGPHGLTDAGLPIHAESHGVCPFASGFLPKLIRVQQVSGLTPCRGRAASHCVHGPQLFTASSVGGHPGCVRRWRPTGAAGTLVRTSIGLKARFLSGELRGHVVTRPQGSEETLHWFHSRRVSGPGFSTSSPTSVVCCFVTIGSGEHFPGDR